MAPWVATQCLNDLKQKLKADFNVYTFNFSGHGGASVNKDGFGIEVFADD